MKRLAYISAALLLMGSCMQNHDDVNETSCGYAHFFDIAETASEVAVVTISPYDGSRDTLIVSEPVDNFICMSTSHVACLSEIGADSLITAVSGLKYTADPDIRKRQSEPGTRPVFDIGYEASLDYERIISLNPDLIVTYTVSSAEPPYLSKLRSLGMKVLVLHDHMENHPLARAEYIRLFGALTGRSEKADSVFNEISERYEFLEGQVSASEPKKVLINIPYADAWYIPGEDNYMSQLIKDAGGEVLGAVEGRSASSMISLEEAWKLSQDADLWLNPGHCDTRKELASVHQLFPSFGPLSKGLPVYNNTLRTVPEGGNDFFESGAVRPDLILSDLIYIMSAEDAHESQADTSLNYFRQLL